MEKGIMSAHITSINLLYYTNKRDEQVKDKQNEKMIGIRIGKEESNLHQMNLYRSCKP